MELILFCVILMLTSLVGGILPIVRNWSTRHLRLFVAFGAGVLLGAALTHMIPETAEHLGGRVGIIVLLGFMLTYLIERIIVMHPCDPCQMERRMGLAAYVGLSFHSVIDGVALGASLIVPRLGPFVLFAIIAHKVPSTFSLSSILKHRQYSQRAILLLLLIFSFTSPVGAVAAYYLLKGLSQQAIAVAIGIAGGTFLAISTSDLLPELHHDDENKYQNLVSMLMGVSIMLAGSFIRHH